MSEKKPRATKTYLKSVQSTKAHLIEMLQWDTKPILKKAGAAPKPGEMPTNTRFRNIVTVPVTEEDREKWRRVLREFEDEEKRVIAELETKSRESKAKS